MQVNQETFGNTSHAYNVFYGLKAACDSWINWQALHLSSCCPSATDAQFKSFFPNTFWFNVKFLQSVECMNPEIIMKGFEESFMHTV